MSVSGVGSSSGAAGLQANGGTNEKSSADVIQDFLSYMKETPAQRMEDSWLSAHGITKQAFAAMSPEERAKIIAQMKQDIEQQMKQSMDNTAKKQSSAVML